MVRGAAQFISMWIYGLCGMGKEGVNKDRKWEKREGRKQGEMRTHTILNTPQPLQPTPNDKTHPTRPNTPNTKLIYANRLRVSGKPCLVCWVLQALRSRSLIIVDRMSTVPQKGQQLCQVRWREPWLTLFVGDRIREPCHSKGSIN